jgi:uncharacterized protein YkwD
MIKSIKNTTVFILTALISVFIVFTLFAAGTQSLIEVKAASIPGPTDIENDPAPLAASAELSEYENAVAALINSYRTSNGVGPVAYDGSVTYVAKLRSQDLLDRDYFSHYTPEGTTVFNLLREEGISFSRAGENLGHARPAGIGSPEAFLDAWAKSPSHNANMLKTIYAKIGVGMVENGDRIVVTTVFTN